MSTAVPTAEASMTSLTSLVLLLDQDLLDGVQELLIEVSAF
jgi:hypothetical protein